MTAGGLIVSTRDTKDYVSTQFGPPERSVQNIIQVCKLYIAVVATCVKHILYIII
jgi:hypothetical protein